MASGIPIPPEFLEPTPLRYAGAATKGGWLTIVLAVWRDGQPWPDFNNKTQVMLLSGVANTAWDRSFPTIKQCYDLAGSKINKEYQRRQARKLRLKDGMLRAREIGVLRKQVRPMLSDQSPSVNAASLADSLISPRHTLKPGAQPRQAIDNANKSMQRPGMMQEDAAPIHGLIPELESPLSDE